jgi:hypothetical protein
MKQLNSSLFTVTGSTYGLRDVRECLSFFWQGDYKKANSMTSAILVEKPNHPMRFALYRIWVEIAVLEQDSSSLVGLSEHFQLLAADQSASAETFTGLKGLCHLGLDEIEACQLLAGVLSKSTDSYALEFIQVLSRRTGEKQISLWKSEGCLLDYFQLRTLASDLISTPKTSKALVALESHLEEVFPQSPLCDLLQLAQNVTSGNLDIAKLKVESLCRKFPKNSDFQDLSTILLSLRWDWAAVQEQLSRNKISVNIGLELLSLAEFGSRSGTGNRAAWDALVRDLYRKLDVDFIAHKHSDSQRKPWIAYVGPEQWEQVHQNLDTGLELELSHKVYEGDWIFLARKVETIQESKVRIFGIYEASWEGGLGLQSLGLRKLNTVMLFDRSCEVDSLSATMERDGSLGIANVASLGPGDLDKIADAMQDQLLYESGLVQDLVHNLSA